MGGGDPPPHPNLVENYKLNLSENESSFQNFLEKCSVLIKNCLVKIFTKISGTELKQLPIDW